MKQDNMTQAKRNQDNALTGTTNSRVIFPKIKDKEPKTMTAAADRSRALKRAEKVLELFKQSEKYKKDKGPRIMELCSLQEDVTILPYKRCEVLIKVNTNDNYSFHHLNDTTHPDSRKWKCEMGYIFGTGSKRLILNFTDKTIYLKKGTAAGWAEKLSIKRFPQLLIVTEDFFKQDEACIKAKSNRENAQRIDQGHSLKEILVDKVKDWPDATEDLKKMLAGVKPPPIVTANRKRKGTKTIRRIILENNDILFDQEDNNEDVKWFVIEKVPNSFKSENIPLELLAHEINDSHATALSPSEPKHSQFKTQHLATQHICKDITEHEIINTQSKEKLKKNKPKNLDLSDEEPVMIRRMEILSDKVKLAQREIRCLWKPKKPKKSGRIEFEIDPKVVNRIRTLAYQEKEQDNKEEELESCTEDNETEELPSIQGKRIFNEKMNETYTALANVLRPHANLFIPEDPGEPFTYAKMPEREYLVREDCPEILKAPYKKKWASEPEMLQLLNSWIQAGLDSNMICRSNSTITSPIRVVPKPGKKKIRVCIDTRAVNKKCLLPVNKIMPEAESYWLRFAHFTVFSTIDVSTAYHRAPLKKWCWKYTAFEVTEGPMAGVYSFMSLGQGISQSGALFMEMMGEIFRGLPGPSGHPGDREDELAKPFMDDIIVASESEGAHEEDMEMVMSRLQDSNLKLDIKKSQFGLPAVEFLGMTIGNGQIRTTPGRTEKFEEVMRQVPILGSRNTKMWQRIFGLLNYYSRFIPNYSDIVSQIKARDEECRENKCKELLSRNTTFVLDKIDKMVKAIISNVLKAPPPNTAIVIKTDASKHAIGHVLETEDRRPIWFGGKQFSKDEMRMTIFEKELAGIAHACQKYEQYMRRAQKTKILTDNLASVVNNTNTQPVTVSNMAIKYLFMIQNRIAGMDVTWDHLSGLANLVADAISRIDQFKINRIVEGTRTRAKEKLYEELCELHMMSHAGLKRLIHLAREAGIEINADTRKLANEAIDNCEYCRNVDKVLANGFIGATTTPDREMVEIHMDHLELKPTISGHRYVLTMIDPFSKHAWLHPSERKTISEAMPYIRTVLVTNPSIKLIKADNAFDASLFRDLCDGRNVKYKFTASHNSKSNSVERLHGTIRNKLPAFIGQRDDADNDWEQALGDFMVGYNKTPSTVTGYSPAFVAYGILPEHAEDIEPRYRLCKRRLRNIIHKKIIQEKEKYIKLPDTVPRIKIGSKVWVQYGPRDIPFEIEVIEDRGLSVRAKRVLGNRNPMTYLKDCIYKLRDQDTFEGKGIDKEKLTENLRICRMARLQQHEIGHTNSEN